MVIFKSVCKYTTCSQTYENVAKYPFYVPLPCKNGSKKLKKSKLCKISIFKSFSKFIVDNLDFFDMVKSHQGRKVPWEYITPCGTHTSIGGFFMKNFMDTRVKELMAIGASFTEAHAAALAISKRSTPANSSTTTMVPSSGPNSPSTTPPRPSSSSGSTKAFSPSTVRAPNGSTNSPPKTSGPFPSGT